MRLVTNIKPSLTGGTTQAQINNPGITYNQAGNSYNQAGLTYGGLYGAIDVKELKSFVQQYNISLLGGTTSAVYQDSTTTYNQSEYAFNQSGWTYGGADRIQGVVPMMKLASDIKPLIIFIGEQSIQGATVPSGNSLIPMGPGFFLFIPYT